MISTLQIIIIAFAYVCVLFFIAYYSDKNKPLVISPKRKALVYSFSLAIYCTSWTFYGAVGSAAKTGWGYLPIYLGPILVYTLGWPLFRRFVRVGHEQNTTSISDFIASRYGKSQTIAAIVTVIAVIAIIPYIALQLKAITTSIQVFDAQQNLFTDYHFNALFITFLLIVFSILFGTRNLDVTEHQYGMMNAIAFESVIKLIAFCAIGGFALYTIFDGPSSLYNAIDNNPALRHLWFENIDIENFITQTILAAAAILCLPRQFHVSVVEFHQKKDLQYARWIFPGYLILISLFVIPIVIAGSLSFSGQAVNADTYILALPLSHNQSILSTVVFIGGLSAATGMVIVATVALSTMIGNDLVLPIFLQKANTQQFKDKLFNQRMLLIRRIAIASCLLLAYLFYRVFDESQSLASIGFLSFTAVLQFLPALLIGLLWNRATKLGAIAGLLGGIVCWFILTLIPSMNGENLLSSANRLTNLSLLTESLIASLFINTSAIYIFSKLSQQTITEKVQAYAYTRAAPKEPNAKDIKFVGSQILVKDLKSLTAAIVGAERMVVAFNEISPDINDSDHADEEIVQLTEKILSASIGAPSARVVILSAFKEKGFNVDDVVSLLSSTSKALKFNRQMLEVTMNNISQGISVSDPEMNIIGWNNSYEKLMDYPKNLLRIGMPIAELILFNAERGFCGEGTIKEHVDKRIGHLKSGVSYRFERTRTDGTVIEIEGHPLPHGGYVTTYADISEYKKIESALKEVNINLEQRVEMRTDELHSMVNQLEIAKAEAEKANQSKSKFLAAASHDLLQPFNAARLFSEMLMSETASMTKTQADLVEKTDRSLNVAENIISSLIDVSKLDSGTIHPNIGSFNINELLDSLEKQFSSFAEKKSLTFKVLTRNLNIESDPKLLYRILQNFVSNAIRYTHTGGILISTQKRKDLLRISVWDTGIGIKKSEQANIFKEFKQLSDPSSQSIESGIGLGLSISERIAIILGNNISLGSVHGQGSAFHILIKCSDQQEFTNSCTTTTKTEITSELSNTKILCVDNELQITEAMYLLLNRWGCDVKTAQGDHQIDSILQSGFVPDILIVDYQLDQGKTGLEFIQLMKEKLNKVTPAIIVTADHSSEVEQKIKANKFHLLYKPLKPAMLRSTINNILRTIKS